LSVLVALELADQVVQLLEITMHVLLVAVELSVPDPQLQTTGLAQLTILAERG
jgi:hypothetical protein